LRLQLRDGVGYEAGKKMLVRIVSMLITFDHGRSSEPNIMATSWSTLRPSWKTSGQKPGMGTFTG
jgi:hypothetical protein